MPAPTKTGKPMPTKFMNEFKRGVPAEMSMRIRKEGGVFIIVDIVANEPRKGHGSKAMEWLCGLADKHSVILMGCAEPNHGSTMPTEVLFGWYRRFGFHVVPYDECFYVGYHRMGMNMVRLPRL